MSSLRANQHPCTAGSSHRVLKAHKARKKRSVYKAYKACWTRKVRIYARTTFT